MKIGLDSGNLLGAKVDVVHLRRQAGSLRSRSGSGAGRRANPRCTMCGAQGSFVRPRSELRLRPGVGGWITHACNGCSRRLGDPLATTTARPGGCDEDRAPRKPHG